MKSVELNLLENLKTDHGSEQGSEKSPLMSQVDKYIIQRKKANMIMKRQGVALTFHTIFVQKKNEPDRYYNTNMSNSERLTQNLPTLFSCLYITGEKRTAEELYGIYECTKFLGFYDNFSKSFNNTDLIRLLSSFSFIKYSKGHLLTRKGDRSERVYYLLSGSVGVVNPVSEKAEKKLVKQIKKRQDMKAGSELAMDEVQEQPDISQRTLEEGLNENEREIIAVLNPGAVMGDLGVVFFSPRSATIECLAPCQFMYIDSELFRLIMKNEILKSIKERCKEVVTFTNMKDWSQQNLAAIQPYICRKQISTNTVVYSNKTRDFNLYYVESGQVNLYFNYKSDSFKGEKRILVSQVLAGQYFGDEEGFIEQKKVFTAMAVVNNTKLVYLDKQKILNNYPQYLKLDDMLELSFKRKNKAFMRVFSEIQFDKKIFLCNKIELQNIELRDQDQNQIRHSDSNLNSQQIKSKFIHKSAEQQVWIQISNNYFKIQKTSAIEKACKPQDKLSSVQFNSQLEDKQRERSQRLALYMSRPQGHLKDVNSHIYSKMKKGINEIIFEMSEMNQVNSLANGLKLGSKDSSRLNSVKGLKQVKPYLMDQNQGLTSNNSKTPQKLDSAENSQLVLDADQSVSQKSSPYKYIGQECGFGPQIRAQSSATQDEEKLFIKKQYPKAMRFGLHNRNISLPSLFSNKNKSQISDKNNMKINSIVIGGNIDQSNQLKLNKPRANNFNFKQGNHSSQAGFVIQPQKRYNSQTKIQSNAEVVIRNNQQKRSDLKANQIKSRRSSLKDLLLKAPIQNQNYN